MKESMLDGFALLYACKVKLPHEAFKAELTSLNITQVAYYDLTCFCNLKQLDLSDNRLNNQSELEKLVALKNLESLNLAQNNIKSLVFLSNASSNSTYKDNETSGTPIFKTL